MILGSDNTFKYSLKSDGKMTGHRDFCLGQIFGVFVFCVGFVGGILIGIYVYHGGPDAEVTCKNLPKVSAQIGVTTQSPQQISTTVATITTTTTKQETFTYGINNQLQEPFFSHNITMEIVKDTPLIDYMQQAVDMDNSAFAGFTCTYFSSLGFFIDSINKLAGNYADNKTYWQLFNATGSLSVGVSSYTPTDGDNVLFNFTVYTNHTR